MKTYISMLLDESGSMDMVKEKTIKGFNEYIDSINKLEDIKFTLTKFNNNVFDPSEKGINIINDIKTLNDDNYQPCGSTPLYDAIGMTVKKIEEELKNNCTCDKCGCRKNVKVIMTIITDGEENSSKEYTKEMISKMISDKEKEGWLFIYLGSSPSTWGDAGVINIRSFNTLIYDVKNIDTTYRELATYTTSYVGRGCTGNLLNKEQGDSNV